MVYNTELTKLLRYFPCKKWDWEFITSNPNITFEYILENKKNSNIAWYWRFISQNKSINIKDIINNINLPWDWEYVALNTNIDLNSIELYKFPRLLYNIYKNSDIINYLETSSYDLKFNQPLSKCLDWNLLSSNTNLTIDIIINNLDKQWNWFLLSNNKNIKFKDILKHLNIINNWNWYELCLKEDLEWNDIISNPKLPWDWSAISQNYNLTTFEFIMNNPDKPWKWLNISKNPNITWDIISSNPELPWDWYGVSQNPNITFNNVRDSYLHITWCWYYLSCNLFNYHPYFQSNKYNKESSKKMHDIIYEELISKACHPDRIFNWNEDFCNDYPEEYNLQVQKYKLI
jgi:hypothetical protein